MKRSTTLHRTFLFLLWVAITVTLLVSGVLAQNKSTISGRVTDSGGGVLQGAQIKLNPGNRSTATDAIGYFNFYNVPPGNYTVEVSYLGFNTFTANVTVGTAAPAPISAVMTVSPRNEEVVVTAERPHGEAEAINRTIAADNIVQVLTDDVITSLPNANIADALGRLPSVTIERDEGEGKYVQIRGTQPRLTNVTIDGVNVPSPESGVRQIKLDVIASDLVESVEINKTLQANMDGDGIGGSVNLKTKTAGEVPAITLYGLGGYTPIQGGREAEQFGGTLGKRFGTQKKLGLLFGGTYDYNARGIHDIEPVPTASSLTPHYDSMDLRDYTYYRTRWGLTGSADYKVREGSSLHLRGLYSTFKNWGNKWVYTFNDGSAPQYSQDWRRPDFAIGSIVAGGHHQFSSSWLAWDASVSRARQLSGFGGASYAWMGDPNISCFNDQSAAASVYRPGWSSGCYGSGADNALDRNNYGLTEWDPPTSGRSVQLNLQGSAAYGREYHIGTRYGTIEFGGKMRNGHKFDDTVSYAYTVPNDPIGGNPIPIPIASHPEWDYGFTDPGYYDKTYKFGTTTDWRKVGAYVLANPGLFTLSSDNSSNYDYIERVGAGYIMNTINLSNRVRLVAGVRFEATHLDGQSFGYTNKLGQDYLDALPSAALRYAVTKNSGLRLVYSRGLSRPDPQDIVQANSAFDHTVTPNVVGIGNANLKAEHSANFDLLYEHYLEPLGLVEAGFFYKRLSDPIVNGLFSQSPTLWSQFNPTSPYVLVSQVQNAGSAWVYGFEISYQQHMSFLPGVMKGFGLSANYSWTNSQASGLLGLMRDDKPRLQRQAPNTWNFSPTYDTKHFSMRMGMTYNDTMIFQYQYQNLTPGAGGLVPVSPLPPLGAKGPAGDNYLYSHFQIDVQASYKINRSLAVYGYGLNLNNEVFGFYNGSPQYVVQREYYHPTYAGGLKYTFSREK